ncbi:cytochrome c, mono- and diheme variants family [Hoeflea sp. IMCC20628]|uniref:c-type cytochrome n=1 Tax=Hoeflea sp. IMCC20628 TaxID=1620421 RepID=UPI00063B0787|nr:cytochrome c [Hoeflea sp. IMCC20628]AKI01340.1 cytochrome c, mono- and diheme variants family [Hoeflea sp. IMCC20628]
MKRLALGLGVLAAAGAAVGLWLTAPVPVAAERLQRIAALDGDAAAGEMLFWAGGCASCHAAPGAKDDARLLLSGGVRLTSDFGTFIAPNISPDPQAGIGSWSISDFANAMLAGVSPDGRHYYPAFPYGSYTRMTDGDIADLFAFMKTLPESQVASLPHEVGFPFNIRRSLGGWKLLFFTDAPRENVNSDDPLIARGQYLVEGPGHCGECHTPRNPVGGFVTNAWLSGAQNPEGEGVIPNLTPGGKSIGGWSAADIAYYLESGFTPDFDSVGGSMVEVQANMAKLKSGDRDAIAAYLKALPERANGWE